MSWKCKLLLVLHLIANLVAGGEAEIVVQINTKKWMFYVPERFLSMTIDPVTLAGASPLTQESFNMAKGLSPSFVRIGGFGTDAVYFGKTFGVNGSTVSESQWDSVNDFAQKTGLNIIASLNPTIRSRGDWDPQNSLELISYSNEKDYDVVWQLGYDSIFYGSNGIQLGRDLNSLKKILDDNLKYSNLPVFAPDVTSLNGAKQIRFIKDLLLNTGNNLGSIVLQPQFSKAEADEDPYDAIVSMTNELDTYVWNKEVRIGRALPRKPIWIAESSPSQGTFKEAMKLTKRLGAAARSGVQVYLRQAGVTTLKSPTPDFWVALLYKNLVGQGVLESKIISGNETGLHTFSHCTPSIPQERSVLDTDWIYEKGAVTIFGVNESPESIKVSLKATNKDEPLHIYVLTTDKSEIPSSGKTVATLLNGQELQLSPTWDLPVLSPRVKRPNKSTTFALPPESIFFIVMPDTKIRSCSVTPISTPDLNLSDLTKRFRSAPTKKVASLQDDDLNTGGVYVSFTKKKRHDPESGNNQKSEIGKTLMKNLMSKLAPKKIETPTTASPLESEAPVKYVTFNENSFLSKLAEGMREDSGNSDGKEKRQYSASTVAHSNLNIKENEPRTKIVLYSEDSPSKMESTDEVSDPSSATLDSYSSTGRKRRSSDEEIPSILPGGTDQQTTTLKQLTDSMKSGKSTTVLKNLKQVEVTYKSAEIDETENKPRCVRDITRSTAEEESEEETSSKSNSDKDEESKTTELIKIVEETEKMQNVSDSKDSVVVPPNITQEKLDQVMLETARTKSEAEPDCESDSKEQIKRENGSLDTASQQENNATEDSLVVTPNSVEKVPSTQSTNLNQRLTVSPVQLATALPINEQAPNIPMMLPMSTLNPTNPVDGLDSNNFMNNPNSNNPVIIPNINPMHILNPNNPMNVPNIIPMNILTANNPMEIPPNSNNPNVPNINPMTIINPNNPINVPNIPMNIPSLNNPMNDPNPTNIANSNNPVNVPNNPEDLTSNIDQMSLPISSNPVNVPSRLEPIYNVKKEEAINNILSQMVAKEEAKLNKLPVEVINPEGIEKDEELVPVNLSSNDTIMMSKSDVKSLDVEKEEVKTLESSPQLEIINEDDEPKIKVYRQIVTPLPQTATLTSPAQTQITPNPARPATQIKIPTVVATSEERLKSLQKRMDELRSQQVATRAIRLEEIKKQVASARSASSQGTEAERTIRNTIKRREAELKEWFKKFYEREARIPRLAQVISTPGVNDKIRPRRLLLFPNDKLESLIKEDLSDSNNQKRSTELKSSVQNKPQEAQPQTYSLRRMRDAMGQYLFPLDDRTHATVYNNKIYPAKLYGIIGGPPLPATQGEDEDSTPEIENTDEYNKESSVPESNTEKVVIVPKEAFMKEINSDFIPVVIVPPSEISEPTASDESPITRNKRSVLTDWEDRLQRIKDDLLPKITSFVKTLSDNPPWRRDLDRTSRMRRSVKELIRTNDLRSLLHRSKIDPLHLASKPQNTTEIENYVINKVDKAENELFDSAKQYTELAEKVGQDILKVKIKTEEESPKDIQYCEEIGTPTKSVIRDPFDTTTKGSNVDVNNGEKLPEKGNGQHNDNKFIDAMFASAIEEKFTQFLDSVKHLLGLSSESS